MLFKDQTSAPPGPARSPPPAVPPAALAKDATKHTADGAPVHSLATLLADLATITANRIQPAVGLPAFTLITTPLSSSAVPSNSSACSTASGTRSQPASDHTARLRRRVSPSELGGSSG